MENNTWQEVKQLTKKCWQFGIADEPYVLHVIKSAGFEDMYYYFQEDAFQLEPWKSGINFGTKKQIEELFKISLNDEVIQEN